MQLFPLYKKNFENGTGMYHGNSCIEPEEFNALTVSDAGADHTYHNEKTQDG